MISSDLQQLSPSAVVELFILDATAQGAAIYRFHAGVNELGNDVVWQGETYLRWPIQASGFAFNGSGQAPRPNIRVANVTGVLGAEIEPNDDLVGAKVTRKRTFLKYLDAVNFAAGNALADPNAHYADDVFYVDRKATENKLLIEWELTSAGDTAGVMLPRRQIVNNVCSWRYRSAECSYAGGAVANANDVLTGSLAEDKCGKRLASCKLRFPNQELPYGGFPSAGLVRA